MLITQENSTNKSQQIVQEQIPKKQHFFRKYILKFENQNKKISEGVQKIRKFEKEVDISLKYFVLKNRKYP